MFRRGDLITTGGYVGRGPLISRPRNAFNPLSLPGLAAWYDASDSSTVLTQVGGGTNFVRTADTKVFDSTSTAFRPGSGNWTFCCWVKRLEPFSTGVISLDFFSLGGNWPGFSDSVLLRANDAGHVNFYVRSTDATMTTVSINSNVLAQGVWSFVEVGREGDNLFIRVNNGSPTTTAYNKIAAPYTGIWLGRRNANNSEALNGDMDEVCFWNRALTADERTFLYNSGAGRNYTDAPASLKENLISWFGMDAKDTGDWIDLHGTNHLTPSASRPTATTGVTFNVAQDGQTVRRWLSRHNPAVFWDQGTLANQPTFTNPTTGLTFNGTSSFMDGTGTMAGVFRNRGYGYIFAVCQDTNPTGGNAVHRVVHHSSNEFGGLFRAAFSTRVATDVYQVAGRRLDADTAVSITGESNDANLHLLDANYLWSAGTLALQRDGSQILTGSFASSGNTSDTASWNVILGRAGSTTGFFPGNIRELILVNEQLTAAQILATRRYLQRKWGTPALP